MHDLGFVREHMDAIEKMARDRGIALDLEPFRELDAERRKIITSTEKLKAERNKSNEEMAGCTSRFERWNQSANRPMSLGSLGIRS